MNPGIPDIREKLDLQALRSFLTAATIRISLARLFRMKTKARSSRRDSAAEIDRLHKQKTRAASLTKQIRATPHSIIYATHQFLLMQYIELNHELCTISLEAFEQNHNSQGTGFDPVSKIYRVSEDIHHVESELRRLFERLL